MTTYDGIDAIMQPWFFLFLLGLIISWIHNKFYPSFVNQISIQSNAAMLYD